MVNQLLCPQLWYKQSYIVAVCLISLAPFCFPSLAQSDADETTEFVPGSFCQPVKINLPRKLEEAPIGPAEALPIAVEADTIEAADADSMLLLGQVVMQQGRRAVYADAITYSNKTQQANARGNVVLYTVKGDELQAESLDIDLRSMRGVAEAVSIRIVDTQPAAPLQDRFTASNHPTNAPGDSRYQRLRVIGERIEMQGRDSMVLTNASMTTCPDGNQDVVLNAKQLVLDHATGIGTASHITVRLKGVPVFYFPKLSFPIDETRKTGFLPPSIGSEDASGTVVELPFYINIAPHMDATVTPRIMSKRGVQLVGEFRYLGKQTYGILMAEYLPSDNAFGNEDRYALRFDHAQRFRHNWQLGVNLQDVSDPEYVRDFSSDEDTVAASLLTKRGLLEQHGQWFDFRVRLQANESVNRRITTTRTPYRILPEVGFSLNPPKLGFVKGGVETRLTRFEHEDEEQVSGIRTLIRPYISIPLERAYGSLEPRVSFQGIHYALDQAPDSSQKGVAPHYSLDGKLVFDRRFQLAGQGFYQTLEPRLYYLNVPEQSKQQAFPIVDTQEIQYNSFSHLFKEGRFLGVDRAGDTEQVTVGLTSRVMDETTGVQRLKVNLGQIFYLKDRHIRLNTLDGPISTSRSDFIAEISALINKNWSLDGFTLWGMESGDIDVFWLSADYKQGWRRKASFTYSESYQTQKLIHTEFSVPLGPRWQMDLNTAYSLKEEAFRFSTIGIAHSSCCLATRLEYRYSLDGSGEFSNQVRITLQLDGLGKVRSPYRP